MPSNIISFIITCGCVILCIDGIQNLIDYSYEKKERERFYAKNLPVVQRVLDVINSCETNEQLSAAWSWGLGVLDRMRADYNYEPLVKFRSMLFYAVRKKTIWLEEN